MAVQVLGFRCQGRIEGLTPDTRNLKLSGELFTRAKGLDVANNSPAIIGRDGCMQGRLPASGDAVADIFKQDTGRAVLDFGAAQIGGQRRKALADGALAVIVVAVALSAINQVNGFAAVDDGRLGHVEGGL